MSDAEAAAILANLDRPGTIGMGYLGVVLASMIYGITCIQTFQYYRSERAKRDHNFTRAFVAIIWQVDLFRSIQLILDTVHQVMAIYSMYEYLITAWGRPTALLYSVGTVPMGILVNTVIYVLVRIFYLVRIWRLSRNVYLSVALGSLALARAGCSIGYPIQFMRYTFFATAEQKTKTLGVTAIALEVAATVLYTGTLVYYLYRGRTGLRRTDSMVTKIIAVVVSTSMISVFIAVADLVFYILEPTKMFTLFCDLIIETVDINAALTSLNSREFMSKNGSGGITNTLQFNTIPLSTFSNTEDVAATHATASPSSNLGPPVIAVSVSTEKVTSYMV